jgi:AcrR family transcriptional regulator
MIDKVKLSKGLILDTAADLFRTTSYSQVSMRSIALKLNVKAASLYNHISSKDEILESIIFSLVEVFMETIQKTKLSNKSTNEKLKEIINTHIDIAVKNPNSFATLNNDWMFLKETKRSEFIKSRSSYEADLENILIEGIRKNEIKNVNTKIMIYQMLSSLRNIHLWNRKNKLTSEELKKELPKLILTGLMKT